MIELELKIFEKIRIRIFELKKAAVCFVWKVKLKVKKLSQEWRPEFLVKKIVQNTISGGPPADDCSKGGRGVCLESKQNVGLGCNHRDV